MEILPPRWRLLGLSVALAMVVYVTILVVSIDSMGLDSLGLPICLSAVALALTLLALAIGARSHNLRTATGLLLYGLSCSLCAVSLLVVAVESAVRWTGSSVWWVSLSFDAVYALWPTATLLMSLVLFTSWYRDARKRTDSLLVIPMLVWGLDATRAHRVLFESPVNPGVGEATWWVQEYWWQLTLASAVLFLVVCVLLVWRYSCGKREIGLASLAPVALIVLVVYLDWAFGCFLVTLFLVG